MLSNLLPAVGIDPAARVLRDVIYHIPAQRLVAPSSGVVYNRRGLPAGRVYADGYVRLTTRVSHEWQYAHRVIWSVVNGPIPRGHYIDHINSNKSDNRIINLDAVTPAQNAQRAILFGSALVGEARSDAKLTNELARQIRATAETKSNSEWARELGVDPATIRLVRLYKTWRHVPDKPPHRRKRQKHRDGAA